ncbi:MAG: response regulator transcription factor [Gammaproteobacteria bacterium]|nr:response regulator transcription factor [Gammaproteobacteria bacterium]
MRLLLVEDDPRLGPRLKHDLSNAGFAVDLVTNGIDAEFQGIEDPYDLVILDLGLPQRSGLEVLRNWRKQNIKLLVIILTARDDWSDRVEGLKAGADDYIGKPFHTEELLARIDALLRRSQDRVEQHINVAGLTLDQEQQQVTLSSGINVPLSGVEFRLLRYFMIRPGKILSQTQLGEHIYEGDSDHESNVVEVHISRLRQKIGKDYIKTRRGQGYVFSEPAQ